MNIEDYKDIFEPYEQLIEIEILGEHREVPENNSLLRCFQFLSMETISYGDFCWNGDCANCQVWLEARQRKNRYGVPDKVPEKMKIVKMSKEIRI